MQLDTRLARYEEWAAHVERTRSDYIRRLPLYRKGFGMLTAAGFASFAFGGLVGIWLSMSASFVSVLGYLMVKRRITELEIEAAAVRSDVIRIRQSADPATMVE
jgi:hypothetical protein